MNINKLPITQEEFEQRIKELGIEEPMSFLHYLSLGQPEEKPSPDDFPNNPDSYAPFLEIV